MAEHGSNGSDLDMQSAAALLLAREWRFARAWLARQLGDAPEEVGRGNE